MGSTSGDGRSRCDHPTPSASERKGFLCVGRLSVEIGVEVLAAAAQRLQEGEIRVVGGGPRFAAFEGVSRVTPIGVLGTEAVLAEMTRAVALVLPSICYESFPRTLVEAFACGLPVIASRLGALAELVEDGVTGLHFEAGNAQQLADKMQWALDHPDAMAKMGRNARFEYEQKYTADEKYRQLIAIYRASIEAVSDGRRNSA